ncbi:MAG TPA: DUF4349 domain-containing protein [Dokdonella sp.]
MRSWRIVVLVVALAALPACAKKAIAPAPATAAVAGEQSKAGAFLAYEHSVRVDLNDDSVGAHIDALRDACIGERFGACSLLSVQQSSGNHPRGEIVVRIVPAGVEPLVKLAGEGGTIGNRTTSAEDLADAVADNTHQREGLAHQRARLEEFQARKDLAVADMLTLSRELAALEVEDAAAGKAAAQQRRRIETNRLTIGFAVPDTQPQGSRIGNALKNLWNSFDEGVADALEYLGYGLPFLALGLPLLLILRWLWRRATRPRA